MSVISEETAKKLGLRPVARGGLARAVGGGGKFEIVYGFLSSLELGDVKVKLTVLNNQVTLAHSLRLQAYAELRDGLPRTDTTLIDLFAWAEKPATASNADGKRMAASLCVPKMRIAAAITQKYAGGFSA